jgi:uncharacterized protein (PEP-CTERM system associated)
MKPVNTSVSRRVPGAPALCSGVGLALAMACLPVLAQRAASGSSLSVSTSFTASETYADTQREGGFSGGEFVTMLTPAVRISGRLGPVAGSFDYSLSALHFSEKSQANQVVRNQNGLNTALTITPIDNFAFIDVRASIGQQAISPFGQQAVGNVTQINLNRTEVATLSVSPYLRGAVPGVLSYEVRLGHTRTDARSTSESDSSSTTGSVTLTSPRRGSLFGWILTASRQQVDFRAGRATESDRLNATLTARPHADLQLSLSAGRESTDVGSLGLQRSSSTWGWGGRWTPTERTNISYGREQRYFGNSHNMAFEHRMPRTVWRYADTRDATGGGDPNGVGRPVTLYELYFAQFASVQPDPVQREQLVLSFLRGIGANPSDTVGGGLLTTAVSLQRRQDLSLALLGQRTNLTLQAFSTQSRVLDTTTAGAVNEPVTQRGYNGSLSYRLSPSSSLSLNGTQQKTSSTATRRGNELKSASLNLTSQATRTASTSLSARHAVFNSDTNPYRETSVAASVRFQF